MMDREKVINGLECCAFSKHGDKCEQCPYFSGCETEYGAFVELAHDALALLKAQNDQIIMLERGLMELKAHDPVKPVVDIDTWKCGNCGHTLEHQELLGDNVLFHEQYNFCPECGRPVKWDD